MATSTGKTHCIKCGKDRCTLRCGGCLKEFCFHHLGQHRQELTQQLDEISANRDVLRQSLTEQSKEPQNHALVKQIDKWECESIEKIRKTAQEAKTLLIKYNNEYFQQIETKLDKLTNELKQIREENDFNEISLQQLQEEITKLHTELNKPSVVSIRQDSSSSFINKICVDVSRGEANTTTGSTICHAAISEKVAARSVVSTETQSTTSMGYTQKMAALLSKLATTHQQIDEYSRRRTEQIPEEVQASIARVVNETQIQQQILLTNANARSAQIEEEYKLRLQIYVEELDTVKATNLATLEKDLNLRQEMILEEAKKRIDDLNEEANRWKLGVLREAQAQASAQVGVITEQAATLGAEDASCLLAAKSTTVIRTEARATGTSPTWINKIKSKNLR